MTHINARLRQLQTETEKSLQNAEDRANTAEEMARLLEEDLIQERATTAELKDKIRSMLGEVFQQN